MKIDKITEKECLTGPLPARTPARRRIVLFADFLPTETGLSIAASDLVVAARAAGIEVDSVTLAGESLARVPLSCRTPMYFGRARQALARLPTERADAVVIVLDSLMRAEARATTRFRRIKERCRILMLLADLLGRRQDAIVVVSGSAGRAYLALARTLSAVKYGRMGQLDIRPTSALTGGTLARELGLAVAASDPGDRRRLLQQHADFGPGPRHLTSRLLLSRAGGSPYEDDLRFLIKIASRPALKGHPALRWLRTAADGQAEVRECPAPHRMLDLAQAPAAEADRFGLPISRYMMHLHAVLKLECEFPLTSRSRARAYVDWYARRCADRLPARWVPGPSATAGPPPVAVTDTRADRTERVVLAVLDARPLPEAADGEIRSYLTGNPASIGPSRLAILLGMLCQIPVRLPPGKPVWKSEDIQNWFDATACRLIPGCRGFGAQRQTVKAPVKTLTIFGLASGRTGLGANTQMAARMATELSVPFALHDVDGQAPPRLTRPGAGCRYDLKRDVVLHHVNADRIPLNILTPELARRNDVCHIGFLLWELDRIPRSHRLGIAMLDEIWAPSRFVADLYATDKGTPVHLVRKGLPDLDRLKTLAAGPRAQDRGFTAMVCFDFHSSVERKNPLAAVRAFQIAFPRQRYADCRLIVKTTPTSRGHWGDPANQFGRIRQLAAGDRRIEIVERFVSQPELWRMMNAADCILSTHRAEGFGYVPAQALALAKPLVTTDYGGPRDFCTQDTSFPVAAPLVDVPGGHSLYSPEGAKWADVAPDAVAAALRGIYDDPGTAAARARQGQAQLARDYSMAGYAARCRQRLERIGAL